MQEQSIIIQGPRGTVSHYSMLQEAYLKDDYESVAQYAKGHEELSKPEAIVLKWQWNESDIEIDHYKIELGTDSKLKDAVVYETKKTMYSLYNLEMGTKYYWRVTAIDTQNITHLSEISHFSTSSKAPRFLNISGVTNARDVGGWKTIDGKTVITGKILRMAALDQITAEGKETLLDLGIKTEVEFRQWITPNSGSKLGEDVKFYVCPISADIANVVQSNESTSEEFSQSVRKFFSILADESNYPMVIHCGGGMDRTGYFTFLLNGLLGVGEKDLYRDYLLSNFCNIAARESIAITEYLSIINGYDGTTFVEKIYQYLTLEHQVPEEDLDKVISIMKSE